MALTGVMNPYPNGKLGVIEEGAYADIILVDGNPLEDLSVIGAVPSMFGSTPRPTPSVDTIRLVMKDGKVYKNTL
jgi:imidazolonepropionase-like amidohydrolase